MKKINSFEFLPSADSMTSFDDQRAISLLVHDNPHELHRVLDDNRVVYYEDSKDRLYSVEVLIDELKKRKVNLVDLESIYSSIDRSEITEQVISKLELILIDQNDDYRLDAKTFIFRILANYCKESNELNLNIHQVFFRNNYSTEYINKYATFIISVVSEQCLNWCISSIRRDDPSDKSITFCKLVISTSNQRVSDETRKSIADYLLGLVGISDSKELLKKNCNSQPFIDYLILNKNQNQSLGKLFEQIKIRELEAYIVSLGKNSTLSTGQIIFLQEVVKSFPLVQSGIRNSAVRALDRAIQNGQEIDNAVISRLLFKFHFDNKVTSDATKRLLKNIGQNLDEAIICALSKQLGGRNQKRDDAISEIIEYSLRDRELSLTPDVEKFINILLDKHKISFGICQKNITSALGHAFQQVTLSALVNDKNTSISTGIDQSMHYRDIFQRIVLKELSDRQSVDIDYVSLDRTEIENFVHNLFEFGLNQFLEESLYALSRILENSNYKISQPQFDFLIKFVKSDLSEKTRLVVANTIVFAIKNYKDLVIDNLSKCFGHGYDGVILDILSNQQNTPGIRMIQAISKHIPEDSRLAANVVNLLERHSSNLSEESRKESIKILDRIALSNHDNSTTNKALDIIRQHTSLDNTLKSMELERLIRDCNFDSILEYCNNGGLISSKCFDFLSKHLLDAIPVLHQIIDCNKQQLPEPIVSQLLENLSSESIIDLMNKIIRQGKSILPQDIMSRILSGLEINHGLITVINTLIIKNKVYIKDIQESHISIICNIFKSTLYKAESISILKNITQTGKCISGQELDDLARLDIDQNILTQVLEIKNQSKLLSQDEVKGISSLQENMNLAPLTSMSNDYAISLIGYGKKITTGKRREEIIEALKNIKSILQQNRTLPYYIINSLYDVIANNSDDTVCIAQEILKDWLLFNPEKKDLDISRILNTEKHDESFIDIISISSSRGNINKESFNLLLYYSNSTNIDIQNKCIGAIEQIPLNATIPIVRYRDLLELNNHDQIIEFLNNWNQDGFLIGHNGVLLLERICQGASDSKYAHHISSILQSNGIHNHSQIIKDYLDVNLLQGSDNILELSLAQIKKIINEFWESDTKFDELKAQSESINQDNKILVRIALAILRTEFKNLELVNQIDLEDLSYQILSVDLFHKIQHCSDTELEENDVIDYEYNIRQLIDLYRTQPEELDKILISAEKHGRIQEVNREFRKILVLNKLMKGMDISLNAALEISSILKNWDELTVNKFIDMYSQNSINNLLLVKNLDSVDGIVIEHALYEIVNSQDVNDLVETALKMSMRLDFYSFLSLPQIDKLVDLGYRSKDIAIVQNKTYEQFKNIITVITDYGISKYDTNYKNQTFLNIIETCPIESVLSVTTQMALEVGFKGGVEKDLKTLLDEIESSNSGINVQDLRIQYDRVINCYNNNDSTLHPIGKTINIWDKDDIIAWSNAVKGKSDTKKSENLSELIAVIKRANIVAENKDPRATQILSTLLMYQNINSTLLQISTGEGKTTIVAMLAAAKVLQGEKVDVITSSSILASDGAIKKKDFYATLNLTIGDNASNEKGCYSKDIVYGSLDNFQYDFLKDQYKLKGIRQERPFQTVIVDEVDSMLVDEGSKIAMLSENIAGMEYLESILATIFMTTIQFIGGFTGERDSETGNLIFCDHTENSESTEVLLVSDAMDFVKSHVTEAIRNKYFSSTLEKDFVIPENLKNYAQKQLNQWVEMSILATQQYEDIDYRIKDGEIKPIDKNSTGIVHTNMSWQNGLHQFLQIKHGLAISPESFTTCFISNISYFKKYGNNIYGMTGTLGSEESKKLLSDVYKVSCAIMPTYRQKQLIELTPIITASDETWLNEIKNSTKNALDQNRAVLIICKSIQDVELVKQLLDASTFIHPSKIRIYSDNTSDEGIDGKKIESGSVIIATNLAGRGTDIDADEINPYGGLHVCLTFLPNNLRVEEQALGRTARQGNKGTGQLIIRNTIDDIVEIKRLRDEREKERLENIKNNELNTIAAKDKLFLEHFMPFVVKMRKNSVDKNIINAIEERWGLFLATLEFNKGISNPSYWLKGTDIQQIGNQLILKIDERIQIDFIPSIDLYSDIDNVSLTGVLRNELNEGEFRAIAVNITSNAEDGKAGRGNHWVYVLLYKIGGEQKALVINSLGEEYANAIDLIQAQIMSIGEIAVTTKHTRYQNESEDFDSCGVWVLTFFERTIEYLNTLLREGILRNITVEELMPNILLPEKVNKKDFIDKKRSSYAEIIEENDKEKQTLSKYNSFIQNIACKPDDIQNSCYHTLMGDDLCDRQKYTEAIDSYNRAISLDTVSSYIARYNKAYAIIKSNGDVDSAKEELIKSLEIIDNTLIPQLDALGAVALMCYNHFQGNPEPKQTQNQKEEQIQTVLQTQVNAKKDLLEQHKAYISQAVEVIRNKKSVSTIEISETKCLEDIYEDNRSIKEIIELRKHGLRHLFVIKEKPKVNWWGIIGVFVLGALQLIGGAMLTLVGVANVGMALIGEGIGDLINGIKSAISGEFNWAEYLTNKAISIAISVVMLGASAIKNAVKAAGSVRAAVKAGVSSLKQLGQKAVAKLTGKGVQNAVVTEATKQIGKEATKTLTKEGMKAVGKVVLKEFVEQGAIELINYGVNEATQAAIEQWQSQIAERVEWELNQNLNIHDILSTDITRIDQVANSFINKRDGILHQFGSRFAMVAGKHLVARKGGWGGVIANVGAATIVTAMGWKEQDEYTTKFCNEINEAIRTEKSKPVANSETKVPEFTESQRTHAASLIGRWAEQITEKIKSIIQNQMVNPWTNIAVAQGVKACSNYVQRSFSAQGHTFDEKLTIWQAKRSQYVNAQKLASSDRHNTGAPANRQVIDDYREMDMHDIAITARNENVTIIIYDEKGKPIGVFGKGEKVINLERSATKDGVSGHFKLRGVDDSRINRSGANMCGFDSIGHALGKDPHELKASANAGRAEDNKYTQRIASSQEQLSRMYVKNQDKAKNATMMGGVVYGPNDDQPANNIGQRANQASRSLQKEIDIITKKLELALANEKENKDKIER